ncbi:MAG: UDP-N-acetylglucosamine 2-epimerase (non-hydrolyzing) [Spirochaetales bacterium]|nr:UDP-N-acetylglucosamine 2-epimerase (non-hydrolyzing) [Spirochaetales bacterium]
MKVMVVVGTRPEIIRLSRTIAALRETMECVLVHTGQNHSRELKDVFFEDLGIAPPEHYLDVAGGNLAETLGAIIVKSDAVFEREKPDALLILGDTNSALCVIPAKRRKIPVFHYEAGNRCFDQRVPEEINRKIVDHASDVNLAYSGIAKQNLLREGFPMDRVFAIGSPMFEVLGYYAEKIEKSDATARLGLEKDRYFVLSAHREENVDDEARLRKLFDALEGLLAEYPYPVVFSVHPRTERRLAEFGLVPDGRIVKTKPLGFTDYVALQKDAYCVLSDSGTITEESSILGFPALNLRETHERLEGMEEAAVIMTGFSKERILAGIGLARRQLATRRAAGPTVPEYGRPDVSEKIVRIIASYTDYVNRVVWRR